MRAWRCLVLILVTSTARADGPPSIDDAIQRAAGAGKPLVVEFYTDWCKPCRVFETEILPAPEVRVALSGVHFVRYDAEAEPGIAAAARYQVSGFPTFLAIDKGGVETTLSFRFEPDPR